jgi:hypothetical protein
MYTEVSILHPEYRPGDADWNRAHDAWPVVEYVTSLAGLKDLVVRYAGERMVCYGLNPRSAIHTKPSGVLRSAKEDDILASQNLLHDVDLIGTVTPERQDDLKRSLSRVDEYFLDLGCKRPTRSKTGRGAHALSAYQPIMVADCPDIRERLRIFRDDLHNAIKHELSRLEARLDSTQDLRRVVRVYGTAKPEVGFVSRFYGKERREDPALREYLLNLSVPATAALRAIGPLMLSETLPSWFTDLLDQDERVRSLWHGQGKTRGDTTASGYDFSLLQALVRRGHADPAELGTILALRPGANAKGPEYIARTIAIALQRGRRQKG